MNKRSFGSSVAAILLAFHLVGGSLISLLAQDLRGGASLLISQDLIGGA